MSARRAVIGIYDYSYAPYALGDALTWTMNLNVLAAEAGANAVDEYLVIDPGKPSSRYQPFINTHNYVSIIDGLFPAFLCSPWLRSLKVIRHAGTFHLFLLREALRRRPMWPSFLSHLNRKLDFISHRRIDAFYARHGYLPWLAPPRGYGAWADAFRRARCEDRFVVAVNVRQSALSLTPANLYRDAPIDEWLGFMSRTAERHPEVLFVILGGYTEWDRRLLRLSNVLIARTLGLGLGHELALIHQADLFMGSSSGFAVMATLSNIPYVITKIEHLFVQYADVSVGDRHYRFGNENQVLYWETETQEVLLDFFEEIYARRRAGVGS